MGAGLGTGTAGSLNLQWAPRSRRSGQPARLGDSRPARLGTKASSAPGRQLCGQGFLPGHGALASLASLASFPAGMPILCGRAPCRHLLLWDSTRSASLTPRASMWGRWERVRVNKGTGGCLGERAPSLCLPARTPGALQKVEGVSSGLRAFKSGKRDETPRDIVLMLSPPLSTDTSSLRDSSGPQCTFLWPRPRVSTIPAQTEWNLPQE